MLEITFIEEIINHLDEAALVVATTMPGANRVQLADGIIITKIGDSVFTENGTEDWIESTYGAWEELTADVAYLRNKVAA